MVLLMFNEKLKWNFKEISENTKIGIIIKINIKFYLKNFLEDIELKRTLQSLACGKFRVLIKQPKGKDINSDDNLLASFCGGNQSNNNNLMLQALCIVAEDSSSSPLVQRHLLDFLCMAIPLNSKWTSKQQLVDLVGRTLFLVLRRDMSLNRRLYQWLLNRFVEKLFLI